MRQSKLNIGGFATGEELHFSVQGHGCVGASKADGYPHGSECCSEVIEVGAGELLRLGGEGLVLLPDARRRHTREQRRRVVGARAGGERPSFVVFDFCGWNVGILDLE